MLIGVCGAPQLLIALAGRLQPFCRLARLLFVHLSPLTEAPARSAKSVPETVTLRFAMQSQLCTLHSISRQYSEYFTPPVPAVKIGITSYYWMLRRG